MALLRLLLLFALFCWILFILARQIRTAQDSGFTLAAERADTEALLGRSPALGINVELEQYTPQERRSSLKRLREAGFVWVRQRFDWNQIEPLPNQFRWTQSDALFADITAQKLIPVVVLDGSPRWARADQDAGNPLAPPKNVAHFARFAQKFAHRYGAGVRFYQLWDEPNIAPHWGNRLIDPVGYARLLAAGGEAIRSADADAVIVAAALAPTEDRGHTAIDERFFLQRLYAAQKPSSSKNRSSSGHTPNQRLFDVVAIQPFGFGHSPTNQQQHDSHLNFQRALRIRRVMVAAGDAATPIWAVRYGWNRQPNSTWQSVSPQQQQAFAIEALDIARQQWPWLTAMGWAIDQPAAPPDDPAWGFAIDTPLLQEFRRWTTAQNSRPMLSLSDAKREQRRIFLFTLLMLFGVVLLIAWRSWAAATLLPWTSWRNRYCTSPLWFRIALWALLFLLYHIAVWPPLILFCLVIAALFSSAQPFIGLALAVLLLPFHDQHKELLLLNGSYMLPPAYALLAALVPSFIHPLFNGDAWQGSRSEPQKGPLNNWDRFAIAWFGLNLLSARNVWNWPAYYEGLLEFVLAPLLFYLAIRILIRTDKEVVQLIWALAAGGTLAALVGLTRWFWGGGTNADGLWRLVGPHFSPNHTALYLLRTLFLCIGLWISTQFGATSEQKCRAGKVFALSFSIIVLVALILTASRGALLLGLPTGGVILWWQWVLSARAKSRSMRVHRTRFCSWGAGGLLTVMGVVIGAPLLWWLSASVGVLPRALSPQEVLPWERLSNSATVLQRMEIWRATLRLWRDQMLVGVGPGGFFWRYPAYTLEQPLLDPNLRHPHNVWLEYLSSWGILGLLWIGSLCMIFWRSMVHGGRRKQTALSWLYAGVGAGLVAAFAHGQVDAFGLLPDLAAWNWVALGVWSGRSTIEKR